jgi:hypothetical protein
VNKDQLSTLTRALEDQAQQLARLQAENARLQEENALLSQRLRDAAPQQELATAAAAARAQENADRTAQLQHELDALRSQRSSASAAVRAPADDGAARPGESARAAEVAQLREEVAALRQRAAKAEAAAAAAVAAARSTPNGKASDGAGPAAPAVVERQVIVEVPVERIVEREVYVAVTPRRGEHIVESPTATPTKATPSPSRGTC